MPFGVKPCSGLVYNSHNLSDDSYTSLVKDIRGWRGHVWLCYVSLFKETFFCYSILFISMVTYDSCCWKTTNTYLSVYVGRQAHTFVSRTVDTFPCGTERVKTFQTSCVQEQQGAGCGAVRVPPAVYCYICGKMFGTRSIGIHEPQCLDRWRQDNEQLPAHQRRADPVKPQTRESARPGHSLRVFRSFALSISLSSFSFLLTFHPFYFSLVPSSCRFNSVTVSDWAACCMTGVHFPAGHDFSLCHYCSHWEPSTILCDGYRCYFLGGKVARACS
jgi:hypothetical protein